MSLRLRARIRVLGLGKRVGFLGVEGKVRMRASVKVRIRV